MTEYVNPVIENDFTNAVFTGIASHILIFMLFMAFHVHQ